MLYIVYHCSYSFGAQTEFMRLILPLEPLWFAGNSTPHLLRHTNMHLAAVDRWVHHSNFERMTALIHILNHGQHSHSNPCSQAQRWQRHSHGK